MCDKGCKNAYKKYLKNCYSPLVRRTIQEENERGGQEDVGVKVPQLFGNFWGANYTILLANTV